MYYLPGSLSNDFKTRWPDGEVLWPDGEVLCVYQLDFVTPGSKPSLAISRKALRHKPKSR